MSYDAFLLLCKAHGLPIPETEVVFAPPRKWRADYLFRDAKVIVEREGGIFRGGPGGGQAKGGHSSAAGILRDMEKSNAAQALGYRYFRFQPRELDGGSALGLLKQVLA